MPLPSRLQRIVDLFAGAPRDIKLQALLEYSRKVPPLPEHVTAHPGALEQVVECQTPFFLRAEVGDDRTVQVWFDCPPEAPTTRGFAGVLAEGLNGATVDEVLGVPDDFYVKMGLADAISALRLRGMSAILARLKRQVREAAPAVAGEGVLDEGGRTSDLDRVSGRGRGTPGPASPRSSPRLP